MNNLHCLQGIEFFENFFLTKKRFSKIKPDKLKFKQHIYLPKRTEAEPKNFLRSFFSKKRPAGGIYKAYE